MTPIEYRQFAADCGRWACAAKDTVQRVPRGRENIDSDYSRAMSLGLA